MGRDWIIDVLADLRNFARENDLPLLTAQLEEAGLVAAVEIASRQEANAHPLLSDLDGNRKTLVKPVLPRRS